MIVVQLHAITAHLKPIAGMAENVAELGGRVEHVELTYGDVLELSPTCGTNAVAEELLDARLCKTSDHGTYRR